MASQPHPVVYYWKAIYKDGEVLEQYDRNTGVPIPITRIQNERLKSIGWYPIPLDLAELLNKTGTPAVSNPLLPEVVVQIEPPKRFILFMRNYISQEECRICENCGQVFQASKFFGDKYHKSPICPYCGAHDYYICKNCGERYETFSEVDDTPPEKGGKGHCKKCGGYLALQRITSKQYSREKRWREYAVGFQETVRGKNVKAIIFVDERGRVEMRHE